YRPGRRYHERWNGAPLNTTLVPVYAGSPAVVRQDNGIYASFAGYVDGDGHVGWLYPMTNHHLTLHQGDTLLGESTNYFGSWNVAAEPTRYRMRYVLDLPDPFRLSRRMESVWTFTTSADQQGELPLTS